MNKHYYKFRSLQNLRYFIDIIVNKRLYAAQYDELNDPMEGAYMIETSNQKIIRPPKDAKDNTRICSLSKDYKHTLLWSHYADSHKGCCIEVSAKNKKEIPTEINYETKLPMIKDEKDRKTLLSTKSILWEYEDEVRFFRKTSYFNVNIHGVIFGQNISTKDFSFYKKLINAVDSQIRIRKIEKDEIIDGFNHDKM